MNLPLWFWGQAWGFCCLRFTVSHPFLSGTLSLCSPGPNLWSMTRNCHPFGKGLVIACKKLTSWQAGNHACRSHGSFARPSERASCSTQKQGPHETYWVKTLASRSAAQCQVYRCTPDMGQDVQRWESSALLERQWFLGKFVWNGFGWSKMGPPKLNGIVFQFSSEPSCAFEPSNSCNHGVQRGSWIRFRGRFSQPESWLVMGTVWLDDKTWGASGWSATRNIGIPCYTLSLNPSNWLVWGWNLVPYPGLGAFWKVSQTAKDAVYAAFLGQIV